MAIQAILAEVSHLSVTSSCLPSLEALLLTLGPGVQTMTGTPALDGSLDEPPEPAVAAKESLLLAAARAKKGKPEETEAEKLLKEEQAMMADITRTTALKGVKELAKVCHADDGGAAAAAAGLLLYAMYCMPSLTGCLIYWQIGAGACVLQLSA